MAKHVHALCKSQVAALQRELDEANTRARVNWDAAKELTDQLMTCRADLAACLPDRQAAQRDAERLKEELALCQQNR